MLEDGIERIVECKLWIDLDLPGPLEEQLHRVFYRDGIETRFHGRAERRHQGRGPPAARGTRQYDQTAGTHESLLQHAESVWLRDKRVDPGRLRVPLDPDDD